MKTILFLLAAKLSGRRGFSDACPLEKRAIKEEVQREEGRNRGGGGRNEPSGPDGVNSGALGNVDDEVDVGIVVVVGAAGHLDVLVGHADVVGVDLEVLGRRHDDKLDGALITKRLVRPLADRANLLDGGNAVVADEHLGDDRVAALLAHELGDRAARRRLERVAACVEGE